MTPKTQKFLYGGCTAAAILLIVALCICVPMCSESSPKEALIKIPANATTQNVTDTLTKYLGEKYTSLVMRASKFRGSDLSKWHGAYLIEEGMSPRKAERIIATGSQHPFMITINGFRGIPKLADRIALKVDFSSDSLQKVLADKNFMNKFGLTPEQALSVFIDDSYEIFWNVSPEGLVNKVGDHYKKVWNKERTAKAKELGLTPAEVMILCSIVDEESNKIDDKGRIGRLYINRLQKGMKLQADPTVKFALGDFSLRRILNKHLTVKSPYNTYMVEGLPPGPIRTTSVATIDSVLYSVPHNYLYMCAKEDFSGYHAFAETYSEHMENARRYQRALNERGIK